MTTTTTMAIIMRIPTTAMSTTADTRHHGNGGMRIPPVLTIISMPFLLQLALSLDELVKAPQIEKANRGRLQDDDDDDDDDVDVH